MSQDSVILITGAIREPIEFLATVDHALGLVRQGRATRVLVSTWTGQLNSLPGMAAKLHEAGVQVVESAAPEDIGKGAAHAQLKSAVVGLLACPPGSRVLRCRTDKTLKVMAGLEHVLDHELPPAETIGRYPSPFRRKVVILGYSSTAFLWMSDFCYLGLREDLLRGLSLSRHFDDIFFNPIGSPELRVLSAPFYACNVFLTELFHGFSQYALSHALTVWAQREDAGPLPRALARMMALHASAHAGSFLCARDFLPRRPAVEGPLLPLLCGRPQRHLVDSVYIAGFRGTRCNLSTLFAELAREGLAGQSGSAAFDGAMAEIGSGAYADWNLEPVEQVALQDFARAAMLRDKPMPVVTAGEMDLMPFIGRPLPPPQPEAPSRDASFAEAFAQGIRKALRRLGVQHDDPAYAAIAAEIAQRPGLIQMSLEATILFWCGVRALLGGDPARQEDAWRLIAAGAEGRNSDAQMMRGWLLRDRRFRFAPPEGAEEAYLGTLRDISDAARKNFWPALVLLALLRLDGASRHFDVGAAASILRQAARTAGEHGPEIAAAADFLTEKPGVGQVSLLFWRRAFGHPMAFLHGIGAQHRIPVSVMGNDAVQAAA